MSADLSALSRWLFPAVEFSRTGAGLRVKLAGLRRLGLVGGFATMTVIVLIALANADFRAILPDPKVMTILAVALAFCVAFEVVLMDVLSPQENIEFNQDAGLIRTTHTYLWLFQRSRSRDVADIRAAFVDSEEVKDKRWKGHYVFHPMLELKSGAVERLTTARPFERAEATRIVEAVVAMMPGSRSATARPAAQGPTPVEQINAEAVVRQERRFARWFGTLILGSTLVLIWMMRSEFTSRYEATVVEAGAMCQYSWRLSKHDTETKSSDCSFTPAPDRAPRDMQPTVYEGLNLGVRFRIASGDLVDGRIFATGTDAVYARETGKIFVTYDPRYRNSVRRWMGWRYISLMALLPICGVLMFFIPDLRNKLRQRGLVWR
jgi:hypothetical protein